MSDSDQDKAEKPVKLVHYTTAEAAYSILSQGELWMRQASLMNDTQELKLATDIMSKTLVQIQTSPEQTIQEFNQSMENQKEIKETLKEIKEILNGQNISPLDCFSYVLEKIIKINLPTLRQKTYITSFSIESNEEKEHLGRLSMWHSYGSKAGIAIVFKEGFCTKLIQAKKSQNIHITCGKVFYHSTESDDLEKEYDIFSNLPLGYFPFFVKHRGFQEEVEWRLVIIEGESLDQKYTLPGNLTLERDSKLFRNIPQGIFTLHFDPREDIDYIIVGPTFDIDHAYAIRDAFLNLKYKRGQALVFHDKTSIHLSSIPLRQYL